MSLELKNLPTEIIYYTFSFLDPRSILNCDRVCSTWHQLLQDDVLWKYLYHSWKIPEHLLEDSLVSMRSQTIKILKKYTFISSLDELKNIAFKFFSSTTINEPSSLVYKDDKNNCLAIKLILLSPLMTINPVTEKNKTLKEDLIKMKFIDNSKCKFLVSRSQLISNSLETFSITRCLQGQIGFASKLIRVYGTLDFDFSMTIVGKILKFKFPYDKNTFQNQEPIEISTDSTSFKYID